MMCQESPCVHAGEYVKGDNNDLYNVPGEQEVHSARDRQNCLDMLKRFQKEGRNLKLDEIRLVGGDLPWRCIFKGPDAEADYWQQYRREQSDP